MFQANTSRKKAGVATLTQTPHNSEQGKLSGVKKGITE